MIIVVLILVIFILMMPNNNTINKSKNASKTLSKILPKNLSEKITDRVIININNYIKKNIIDYSKNTMKLSEGKVTTNGMNGDELIKSVPNIIFNTIYTNLVLLVDSKSLDLLEKQLRSSEINGVRYTYILHKAYPSLQFRMIEIIGGDTSYQMINELRDEVNLFGKDQIVNNETVKIFDLSVLERLILGSDVLYAECSYIVSSILETLNLP